MRSPSTILAACLGLTLSLGLAACGEDEKPTREETIDGWQMIVEEQFSAMGFSDEDMQMLGISDEALQVYYECFVDEIYDEISAGSLQGLAKGDVDSPIHTDDQPLIEVANQDCLTIAGF